MTAAGGPEPSLAEAQRTELVLRQRLADLIVRRQQAERQSARLEERAAMPGADVRVGAAATDLRRHALVLATEIEQLRQQLRAQEGLVASRMVGEHR